MKEIRLDASKWKTRDDFYDAVLPVLGAPPWHGRNFDALADSIVSDEIYVVRLPFCLLVFGTDAVQAHSRAHLKEFADLIADLAASPPGTEVALIFEPPL